MSRRKLLDEVAESDDDEQEDEPTATEARTEPPEPTPEPTPTEQPAQPEGDSGDTEGDAGGRAYSGGGKRMATTVRLPTQMADDLDERADMIDSSRNAVIIQILHKHLYGDVI